jgi:hypothetical protein
MKSTDAEKQKDEVACGLSKKSWIYIEHCTFLYITAGIASKNVL